jgi:hypothetical protein
VKDTVPNSLASRVLEVICASDGWINSTEIKQKLADVDETYKVSMACHDLWQAKKVNRVHLEGRLQYCARQLEIFPSAAEDLRKPSSTPATKQKARHIGGRTATPRGAGKRPITTAQKLRTLDLVIGVVADDIARVLRVIRKELASDKQAAA